MKNWIIYLNILTVIVLLLVSCKKDDPVIKYQDMRIINKSGHNIETLIISTRLPTNTYEDIASFSMIGNNDTTSFTQIQNLNGDISFRVEINQNEYEERWIYPGRIIDPASPENSYMPNGYYTFTVIEVDTINSNMSVGLSEYSIN